MAGPGFRLWEIGCIIGNNSTSLAGAIGNVGGEIMITHSSNRETGRHAMPARKSDTEDGSGLLARPVLPDRTR